ncbi:MAG: hypothetical protein M2R45_03479 [Verrucomicrobia subdivision 3 bacterium]|nr:hypothetical protein [Limisphaerales bacterium]MCS1416670.1 hypothetical protein [Limisphaerales bacterium]
MKETQLPGLQLDANHTISRTADHDSTAIHNDKSILKRTQPVA